MAMTARRSPAAPRVVLIHPAILGLVTAGVVLGVVIFSADLGNIFAELALLLTAAVLSMSACIAAELIRLGFVTEQWPRYLGSAVMVGVALFLAVAFNSDLSQDVRFTIMRTHYENELDRFDAGEVTGERVLRDGQMRAFYWLRGESTNWVGLVYDPADSIAHARRQRIFGSIIVHVRRLAQGWFLCSMS